MGVSGVWLHQCNGWYLSGSKTVSQNWIISCPLEVLQVYRALRGDLNVDFILNSGFKNVVPVVGIIFVQ